jgi:hypothetical protein
MPRSFVLILPMEEIFMLISRESVYLLKVRKKKRTLAFPYRTRPPVFSSDYKVSTLLLRTLLQASFSFCRASCRCPGDEDYDTIALDTSEKSEIESGISEVDSELLETLQEEEKEEDQLSSSLHQQCPTDLDSCAGLGSSRRCPDGCQCQVQRQTLDQAHLNPNPKSIGYILRWRLHHCSAQWRSFTYSSKEPSKNR